MKASISTLSIFLLSISLVTSDDSVDSIVFFDVFLHIRPFFSDYRCHLTPNNSSFETIYQRANNLRIVLSTTSRLRAIITALHPSHAQATVVCAKRHGFQVRIRSGGHDLEGLSYTSGVPFNSRESNVHGFPSGYCTTLGIGGHFSGGGYGFLIRKYGLSIDNVIDAQLIDANGRILTVNQWERCVLGDKRSGTTSFGIILSWRVKLVRVPPRVTVFTVQRTLEQGATELFIVGNKLHQNCQKDLYIRLQPQPINNGRNNRTVRVSFKGHFLGKTNRLMRLMSHKLSRIGLQRSDCLEMSWVESTVWAEFPNGTTTDVLLDRVQVNRSFGKSKSDYYKAVIPKQGLEKLWEAMMDTEDIFLLMNPYGGRMEEISDTETAFAHRGGNLFMVLYEVTWSESDGGIDAAARYVELSRRLYRTMAPYRRENQEKHSSTTEISTSVATRATRRISRMPRNMGKIFREQFHELTRVKLR
ncbi:FAD-binding and BBE domain-containing protein [Hibiscus syriacus]|uniref:FAD-binding and BBE domain-containing protein n=1 Tax=Hibiscus syriacus TaxID=106335 RepID=A0A6A2WU43_HIBSY|nr:FAD-binding and BBE domain-containing protein [Hibiscus syriacus]